MDNSSLRPWEKLHQQATIVDLHAHPILKSLLFHRSLSQRFSIASPWVGDLNPIDVQTAFPKLQAGQVDVLFSAVYPLEKRLFQDIMFLNLIPLRWIRWLPFTAVQKMWKKVVVPPYFTVTNTMLDAMETAVQHYNRTRPEREVHFAYSGQELETLLADPRQPIVLVHSVEGGHSLEGEIGLRLIDKQWDQLAAAEQEALAREVLANLEALAKRGVAYVVLAHFYPNKLIMPVFPYPEHIALSLIPRDKLENVWRDVNLAEGLTDLGRQAGAPHDRIGRADRCQPRYAQSASGDLSTGRGQRCHPSDGDGDPCRRLCYQSIALQSGRLGNQMDCRTSGGGRRDFHDFLVDAR